MRAPDATDDESSAGSNDTESNSAESPGATDAESVESKRLPAEIGRNLRSLFGTDDRPETFGEWTDAVAAAFGDEWPPDVAQLCHDEAGLHRAEVETGTGTETYRFVCVLDAVMLPFLTETSTVVVHSEGPETGETVTSWVSREGIETDPEDAVLSFGVASVEPDAELTPRLTYESLCPYVHAFPDEDTYERWSEGIDAPTTALPLSDGFGLVRALVRA